MQKNNYPELVDQMEVLGLGRDPSMDLLNGVYRGLPTINLHFRDTIGSDQIDAILHFVKTEASNHYVFTNWDLEVRNQEQSLPLKHSFDVLGSQEGVTLIEGYNLLQGRSIHKTLLLESGEKLLTWYALDFKNTDHKGNFALNVLGNQYNLEAQIMAYPLKEMQKDPEKRQVMRAMEEGRRVPVTLQKENGEQNVYMEAAPKFNTLKFYDADHRPMMIGKALQHKQSEEKAVRHKEAVLTRSTKMRL